MATRRDFLRTGARAIKAAVIGAVVPLPAAAATPGAVTFSSVEELERYQYAALKSALLWIKWLKPYAPPLPPETRAAKMTEYKALLREQFEYKMMRLNRPDIVDSQETLAEVARRSRVPVEQVVRSLPWHGLPEEPFVVLPPDDEFPMPDGVMLYVAATRTYQGY